MKTLTLMLSLLFCQTASANDFIMLASCRITSVGEASKSYGSGIVVKETQGSYYIVTCGHVVDGGRNFTVEFFKNGTMSVPIPASIVVSRYVADTTIDAAMLMVSKDRMLGYKPNVIPFAPSTYQPKPSKLIFGAGCPSGKWMQYWESRINKNYGNALGLNMSPVSGQSGSGIITEINNKPYVIGIVTWSTNDGPNGGGGVSVARIYESIYGNPARDTIPIKHRIVADKAIDKELVDETCRRCGLPRSAHNTKTEPDGSTGYYCPKCKLHGLYYNQHLHQGMEESQFCGPGGCFPQRPRVPERPPQPSPQTPIPDNLFPEDVPETPKEPEIIAPPETHPLGDNGQNIERASFTLLGLGAGAFLWNMFGVPFLVKRAGKIPARILLALGQGVFAKKMVQPPQTEPVPTEMTKSQDIVDKVTKEISRMLHDGVVKHIHSGTVDIVPPTVEQAAMSTAMVSDKNPPMPSIPEGLSRDRVYFNTPFQKKTATAEQVMQILGEIENEYASDKTFTPSQTVELLKQRLKMRYGVE